MSKTGKTSAKPRERNKLPLKTRLIVLTEAGYRCAVPTCRNILALDMHHVWEVSAGGGDEPSNRDGLLHFGRLIAAGLASMKQKSNNNWQIVTYSVNISEKGRHLIDAWKQGDRIRLKEVMDGPVPGGAASDSALRQKPRIPRETPRKLGIRK